MLFRSENVGRVELGLPGFAPCTPEGVMKLLDHYGIGLEGKTVCVVGRSAIVGKPLATLALKKNATILHVHSKTKDLKALTTQADVLLVAAGRALLITAEHVKPGAVVIDVGIHRNAEGKLCGDVDFEAIKGRASAISPVPGGVGPMTILQLLENTVTAFERLRQAK